ncbi:MAG: hypothetical protein HUU15_19595 [Candidatus Brocadiae bacterium]|nr:hypothetical protein [Candidatus Brocadiia bacterium]
MDGCPCKDGTPESPLPPTTAPAAGAPGTKSAISVTAAGSPPGASPPAKRVLVAATVTLTTSAVTALPAVKMASNTVVVTLLLTAFSVTPQALVVLQGSSDLENWSTRATWNVNALGSHALSPPASGVSPTYVRLALQGPGAGLVILEDVCFWISTL